MVLSYLENFAQQNGFVGVVRTSAKTGLNINNSFSIVVREVFKREICGTNVDNDNPISTGVSNTKKSFRLDGKNAENDPSKKKKGCC